MKQNAPVWSRGFCLRDDLVEETLKVAAEIAEFSTPSVMIAKESVNRSFETTLSEGFAV